MSQPEDESRILHIDLSKKPFTISVNGQSVSDEDAGRLIGETIRAHREGVRLSDERIMELADKAGQLNIACSVFRRGGLKTGEVLYVELDREAVLAFARAIEDEMLTRRVK